MDLLFFGLSRPPFDNTPNPAHFVNLASHRYAIETLQSAVDNRRGIVLVTGAPGTGKTLMARMLKQRCGLDAAVAVVARPCADAADFWSAITDGFRLSTKGNTSPAHDLERFAEQLYQQDVPAVLIIEAAHDLPDDCLDLLRRLSAVEADDMPLIQVVLLGWPKLAARFLGLAGAAMQQRVYRHVKMEPLSDRDTAAYIRGQIRHAGGPEEDIFTEDAMQVIHRRTGGIPRLINWLCEALLAQASDAQVRSVDAERAEAIPFDMSHDPELFEAQLAADEAGVLFNAQLKEHPVIRTMFERLAQIEAVVAQCATDTGNMREMEPAIARRFRRYDRVFERMVPMLRSLQHYRLESEAVLAQCRQACERLEEMVKAPESILKESLRLSEEMHKASEGTRDLLGNATKIQEAIRKHIAACEEVGRRMVVERKETVPVMNRTKRMISVLRKVHHVTHERCQKLDDLTAKAQGMCERMPGRIEEMERALAQPAQVLDQMREVEGSLRKHVEAGEEHARDIEQTIAQAVHAARRMREEIEHARTDDETRPSPAAPVSEPQGAETTPQDLADRVQELRDLVKTARRVPAPESLRTV